MSHFQIVSVPHQVPLSNRWTDEKFPKKLGHIVNSRGKPITNFSKQQKQYVIVEEKSCVLKRSERIFRIAWAVFLVVVLCGTCLILKSIRRIFTKTKCKAYFAMETSIEPFDKKILVKSVSMVAKTPPMRRRSRKVFETPKPKKIPEELKCQQVSIEDYAKRYQPPKKIRQKLDHLIDSKTHQYLTEDIKKGNKMMGQEISVQRVVHRVTRPLGTLHSMRLMVQLIRDSQQECIGRVYLLGIRSLWQ